MVFSKNIIPLIESKLPQLTPRERKIADYFLNQVDRKETIDASSKIIAEILGVSEASLTRFAQKYDFRGFREFIYAFNQLNTEKSTDFSQPVLESYQVLLNKTHALVDMKNIRQITALLLSKKRVFIYGKGSSGMVAREMKLRFMRVGLDCEAIIEGDMIRMNEVRLGSDCLVIGISISGVTRVVLEALSAAKSQQATTVLLTANGDNALRDRFDVVQLFAVINQLENGRSISPQFPILVMVDILYADYINHDREKRDSIWQRTYDVLNKQ